MQSAVILKRTIILSACIGLLALIFIFDPPHKDNSVSQTKIKQAGLASLPRLPLSFEINRGQTDAHVQFLSRGKGYTLFLTQNQAVLSLQSSASENPAAMHLQLIGANEQLRVTGVDELPGKSNYFIGNDPANWQTDISHFEKVRYNNIYPGIDLLYYGTSQQQLEYDFIVSPGSNPDRIRIRFDGADDFHIDNQGDLIFQTAGGKIVQKAPITYQEESGERSYIASRYVIINPETQTIGFEISRYNKNKPLIIDPILSYSTYLGGNGIEEAKGVRIDSAGDIYLTGRTRSTDFPTQSPYQAAHAGGSDDFFVTKLNAAGSTLIYSTYIGGSVDDKSLALAIDNSGNAFVTGITSSGNFPLQNAYQTVHGGVTDAFVLKLNATGSALLYSTLLGGDQADSGQGIEVDASGQAYITGGTTSPNFPTHNAYQSTFGGINDIFVTKLNTSGSGLVYSTYIGGSGDDEGQGLALDGTNNVYLTGRAGSTNFPILNAAQGTHGGSFDSFAAKLAASGTSLLYSTYLGGSNDDFGVALALDSSNNAYITGFTNSSDFPTQNAVQSAFAGGTNDAFVSKVSASGSSLVYSTYLGGAVSADIGRAIIVNSSGEAYVAGSTFASDFPTLNPLQLHAGGNDAFITKFNASGGSLIYSTLLGGSNGGEDFALELALDASENLYISGSTGTTDFPIKNAYQSIKGTDQDVFLTKLTSAPDLQIREPIAFMSNRTGNHEAYSMNLDGSNLLNLSNHPSLDQYPNFSPDGSTVVFDTRRDGNAEIYIIDTDGSNLTRLTVHDSTDIEPTLSPDGQKIAFTSERDVGNGVYEIYVMNIDGSNVVRLTNNTLVDRTPAWSPDSQKLLYTSVQSGNGEIYVMDADGSNKTNLTNHNGFDDQASWSPDGTQIAFHSNRDGANEIFVMDTNGNNQTKIISGVSHDQSPIWSPEGNRILFQAERDGHEQIYVSNVDGTGQINVSQNATQELAPEWGEFTKIGSSPVGNTAFRTMKIDNKGDIDLNVTNITSSDAQFTITPTSFTLAPNASQDVTVTYAPTTSGTHYSTLTITSNDPASPTTNLIINGTALTTLEVSIPDTTSQYASTIDIPIRISNTSGFGVVASEISIAYRNDIVLSAATTLSTGAGTQTTNSLVYQGWSIEENTFSGTTVDTLSIAMSTAQDTLSDEGVLIFLTMQVADVRHPDFTDLELVSVLFNEGLPTALKTDGSLTLTGTDGNITASPDSINPSDTVTITVTDVDFDLDVGSPDQVSATAISKLYNDSQPIILTETGNNTGIFTNTVNTIFSLSAGPSNDGVITTIAGDSICVSYADSLTSAGTTLTRQDTVEVMGGSDGVVQASYVVQALDGRNGVRDTVRVQITDADLDTDVGLAEQVSATITNAISGEIENVTLTETAVSSGTFQVRVPSIAGASGTNNNGELSLASWDTLNVSYTDALTAQGGSAAILDTTRVVNLFGDVRVNDQVQAFDAARLLAISVGLISSNTQTTLVGDVDGNGTIQAFDASNVLQYVVRLIDRFPVHLDFTDDPKNHPFEKPVPLDQIIVFGELQPQKDDTYLLPVHLGEREGILSGTLTLGLDPGIEVLDVTPATGYSSFMMVHNASAQNVRIAFAGSQSDLSGSGDVIILHLRSTGDTPIRLSLDQVALNGQLLTPTVNIEAIETVEAQMQRLVTDLYHNVPNPFNPQTTIHYDLSQAGQMNLVIYSITGQRIRTLVSEHQAVGSYQIVWDGKDAFGRDVSSGVYLMRMDTGIFAKTQKMLLLR